jgi:hypothetical protein
VWYSNPHGFRLQASSRKGQGEVPNARWGKRLRRADGGPQRQFQEWGLRSRKAASHPRLGLVLVSLKPLYGLIIIIIVPVMVPRSRVVAEMKPYAWADVHGYAGTTVPWPIASVVVLNVTTVVLTIAYVVLRHAASPVVIHAASAAMRSFRDS